MSDAGRDDSEAEILISLVRRRYGNRLTAAQIETLRQTVETMLQQVAALRAVPLTNADEPLPPFVAFRAGE